MYNSNWGLHTGNPCKPQVLFPLGDPKKKVENIIDNLSEYKKQCYLITWLYEWRSNFTGGPREPLSPAGPRKPLKG